MHWWLNVFFFINSIWVSGSQLDGWGPVPLETEQICIERKAHAERACRDHPLAYKTVWICSRGEEPMSEPPEPLRGLTC